MRRHRAPDRRRSPERSRPRRRDRSRPAGPARNQPLAGAILRMIWSERAISRAEIARRANLSRSTVSEVVETLLPTGLVAEGGHGASSGGRRPIMLHFQDDACCILGAEMGATHLAVALTNLRGQVLDWELCDHPVRSDPEAIPNPASLFYQRVSRELRNQNSM